MKNDLLSSVLLGHIRRTHRDGNAVVLLEQYAVYKVLNILEVMLLSVAS